MVRSPKANAEFVYRMEDVLQVYQRPYSQEYPVICLDEASQQLIGEIRPPEPVGPGKPARQDSQYARNGTCNLFMMCEPLGGWRHVEVTQRRTRHDWAFCIKKFVAWEQDRNERGCKIDWTFSMTIARHKMKKTYPSIEV